MKNRWQLVVGVRWGRGIEQKGKKTHGHGQQWGDGWGGGDIKGQNGMEKTHKDTLKNL